MISNKEFVGYANINVHYGDPHYISTFSYSKTREGGNSLPLTFVPVLNMKYYLLWVVYYSGDSDGRYQEDNIELIDLFETEDQATENLNIIKDHYIEYQQLVFNYRRVNDKKTKKLKKKWDGSLNLIHHSGKGYRLYPAWEGYFESLKYVEILPITMGSNPTRWSPYD